MSVILDFLQYQVSGMRWFETGIGALLRTMGMDMRYVQSYFPTERTKRILGRFKGWKTYMLSALLGTITPFCSCSSIFRKRR